MGRLTFLSSTSEHVFAMRTGRGVLVEKIDAFCHTMPRAYYDRFFEMETSPAAANIRRRVSKIPSLVDLDVRFRQMDEFGGEYRQVINICAPPVEDLGSP